VRHRILGRTGLPAPPGAGSLTLPQQSHSRDDGRAEGQAGLPDHVDHGGPGGRRSPTPAFMIRTPDQRVRVFVSSTLEELAAERQAVAGAITQLRLTPVLFELSARPYPPRDLYRAYLEQSDIFVGIYAESYGWVGPGMEVSGLEDEYRLSAGKPRLIYTKKTSRREPRLASFLEMIRAEGVVSYRPFEDAGELGPLVADDLAQLLTDRFAGPPSVPPAAPLPVSGPAAAAAPPPAGARGLRRLPVSMTSLLGREQAIGEVAELVERSGVRLVTLTGPGGVGKTRLAVAVGERLRDQFGAGTVFVPLDSVTDPRLVLAAIGRAAGADLAGMDSPVEALAETFGDGAWLLILDNLEQVVGVARDLGELLARCPQVTMLATSRTVLRLAAEREYPVPPLPLPADPAAVPVQDLESWPAVALFVDRASAVRPGFAVTDGNAAAVAEICRRLEGLPLAIELAAARTRLLDPPALLDRLAASLDTLGTGAVDLPERQQTLRATVEWSVGLLDDAERSLLEVTAVFTGGWTVQAASAVAGLEEDRTLGLAEALARHSLVYVDSTDLGSRLRMLETVREFVAERLAVRPDADQVRGRHADYYLALAEQADQPLRGVGQGAWMQRLDAEAGNLAAAVRWYLARDPGPLPHLFRVLCLFWLQQDLAREARSWVEQLLPAAGTLNPQPRAELEWAAAVLAVNTGDDTAALAARRRSAPLLAGIQDPFLHAASQLVIAWTLPITGDFDGALREAAVSLEEFRGQDEPVFRAIAAFTVGSLETALGRYDDALSHLREARDLSERSGSDWFTAVSRVQLGILAVLRDSLGEARPLLDEALDLSLAVRSTPYVTLCLAGYAQLAFADGDPERAARLQGAAEGLRRRVGLRAWPLLRRVEADLVAQVRQRLGTARFDQAFSAGSRLTQQEAVAIVQDQNGPGTQTP
jgi:predicted ATPase